MFSSRRSTGRSRIKRAIGGAGVSAALLVGALGAAAPAHANEDVASVESTGDVSALASNWQVNWQIRGTSHPNERARMSATYTTQGFVRGNQVALQRLVRGAWKDVSTRATASGSFTFQAPSQGRYNYRVIMRGGPGLRVVKAAGATRQIFSYRTIPFYRLRDWAGPELDPATLYPYGLGPYNRVEGKAGECKSIQFKARNVHPAIQEVTVSSVFGSRTTVGLYPYEEESARVNINGKWSLKNGWTLLQGSVSCWKKPSVTIS